MRRKIAVVFAIILMFYVIITPCLNIDVLHISQSHKYWENPQGSFRTENKCRTTSINPRIMTRLNIACNKFFYTILGRKPILNEEFESVIIEEKFRPQEARKMTDGNTNKCLLFANDSVIIMKGDFVTM